MRPRTYSILERAVEEGALAGYHRAHKHNDDPSAENIAVAVKDAVMLAICEVFEFDFEYPKGEIEHL